MLQQTQVSRVVPHYERFLAAFPNPARCARARPADVVRLWSGLGYNRRALNLHRAATVVMGEHGGVMPSGDAALRTLPGVGAYTARAVRSFAFGEDVATADTNAVRVLARCVAGAPLSVRAQWTSETGWFRAGDSWAFNQTMFDLGATVCRPNRNACSARCAGSAPGASSTLTRFSRAPIRGVRHPPLVRRAPLPARSGRVGVASSKLCDKAAWARPDWRQRAVGPTTRPAPNESQQRSSKRASPAGRASGAPVLRLR